MPRLVAPPEHRDHRRVGAHVLVGERERPGAQRGRTVAARRDGGRIVRRLAELDRADHLHEPGRERARPGERGPGAAQGPSTPGAPRARRAAARRGTGPPGRRARSCPGGCHERARGASGKDPARGDADASMRAYEVPDPIEAAGSVAAVPVPRVAPSLEPAVPIPRRGSGSRRCRHRPAPRRGGHGAARAAAARRALRGRAAPRRAARRGRARRPRAPGADDALVAVLAKLADLPRRQPLHDLGVQVRAARGGRQAAPSRLAGTRGAARARAAGPLIADGAARRPPTSRPRAARRASRDAIARR